jgi:hypothetical protein
MTTKEQRPQGDEPEQEAMEKATMKWMNTINWGAP